MRKSKFILAVLASMCLSAMPVSALGTGTNGTIAVGSGTFTYSTSTADVITATFVGNGTDGTWANDSTIENGYANVGKGYISAINPKDTDRAAQGTDLTIGDGVTNTVLNTALAAAPKAYVVFGDKKITVKENAYVGLVVGGYEYSTGHTSGMLVTGADSYHNNGKQFAPKAADGTTITINVEGGSVGQIRGGNNGSSTVVTTEITAAKTYFTNKHTADGKTGQELNDAVAADLAAYLEDPAWTLNEKIIINVNGGKVGYKQDGVTKYKDDPSEEAIIGAGGKGLSVNNAVEITISGDADVLGNIYAGAKVSNNVAASTGVEDQAYVKSTKVTIAGGTVTGDIFGGGSYQDKTGTQSIVKDGTEIVLAGGTIKADEALGYSGNVYAAGDKDNIGDAGTKVTIVGAGSQVEGVISGGGVDSTVTGDRKLEVDSSHKGTQDYKLADFKNIAVAGDLSLTSLDVATDADGTSVNVAEAGSITTTAGVLTNLNKLNVDGTLNIDMNGADATQSAVSGKQLTLGDNAVVNVMMDGAEASNSIALFGFDELPEDAGNLIITLNGNLVDSALWSFTAGNLVIQEASTTTLNLSRNQSSFYQAVQAAAAANPDSQMMVDLATARDEAAVKAAIDAMSGHEYATAMSSQIEGNLGHLRRLRGAMGKGTALGSYVVFPGSKGTVDEKGNEVMAATPAVTDSRNWRVGASAFHEETSIDSDASGDGYDRSETGAMLTAEYLMNKELTLGGALSYGRTNLRTDGAARRHEDNTRFDVYALYGQKRWSFATSLGLGMHEHELLGGDVDGYSINFLQDAAYTVLSCDDSNVQVFGTIESSWNEIDGFSDGMISADSQDAWATDVTVGLRYNRALGSIGNAPAGVFTVQTGVTASIGDIKSGVDMDINGYGYRQESATRNRWGWNLGAGVDVPVRANVSVYGAAEAVLRGDSSSVDGQVGVKVAF